MLCEMEGEEYNYAHPLRYVERGKGVGLCRNTLHRPFFWGGGGGLCKNKPVHTAHPF